MNLKRGIATVLLSRMLPRFDSSGSPLDRMLAQAVRLQTGAIADEEFRKALDSFYSQADSRQLAGELRFEELRAALDRSQRYKVGINRLAAEGPANGVFYRLSPWRRRLALLQHLQIRCDVLILRQGEQVPPHGHNRVVSGFYLLAGQVACRHYDRVREFDGGLLVRPALDVVHEPGGYTTNSEFYHNIHWLLGIASASYLFRVTVTGTPTPLFGTTKTTSERVYVDPTGPADEEGLVQARYVSETAAKRLEMSSTQSPILAST